MWLQLAAAAAAPPLSPEPTSESAREKTTSASPTCSTLLVIAHCSVLRVLSVVVRSNIQTKKNNERHNTISTVQCMCHNVCFAQFLKCVIQGTTKKGPLERIETTNSNLGVIHRPIPNLSYHDVVPNSFVLFGTALHYCTEMVFLNWRRVRCVLVCIEKPQESMDFLGNDMVGNGTM